jgi:hypothetical protein
MPVRIFLSYRREDSSAWAGRLHDALADRFGERSVFQDVETIRPGEDFMDAVDTAIAQSDAVLAVIGPHWATAEDPSGGRRLESSDDYVRAELEAALRHERRLIPVLVGGAAMPTADQLPAGLRALAQRQAVVLDDATWRQDVEGLARSLRGEPASRGLRRWPIVVGVAAVAVAAAAVGAVLLFGGDSGSNDDDGAEPPECVRPAPPDWEPLDLPDNSAVTVSDWNVEVVDGHRSDTDEGSEIVLRVSLANERGATGYYGDYFFPSLAVDGLPQSLGCFTFLGDEQVAPGRRGEALVGFVVPAEPSGPLELDVRPADVVVTIPL